MGTAVDLDLPRAAIEDARPYCDWSMVVPILILNPASLAAPAAPSLPPTERHRHPRYFLLRGRSGSFVAPAGPTPSGAAPASSSIYYATSFFFARMPIFLGGCVPWEWQWEWQWQWR